MNHRHIQTILAAIIIALSAYTAEAGEAAGGEAPEKPAGQLSGLESFARRLGFGSKADSEITPIPTREDVCTRMKSCIECVVDTIIVTGNTHTDRKTIIREMATRQGGKLDAGLIYRDDSYLRGLGFFSSVDIRASKTSDGRCQVMVRVEERPGLFMKYPWPVVEYDVDTGISYGFRWRVKNFRGLGEDLYFRYKERPEEQRSGNFRWMTPYIGDLRLRFQFELFSFYMIEEPEYEDFLKKNNGGRVMLGLPLTPGRLRQLWFVPEFSIEERVSRMTLEGNAPAPSDLFYRQTIAAYGYSLIYDSRDNMIAPMRGIYSGVSMRFFDTTRGHEQKYSFHSLTADFYLPAGESTSIIAGLDFTGREGDIPDFYRLRLGGENGLRGYYNADLSGRYKIVSSLQIRKRVYGPNVFNLPL
ncbi:MAG TPA: BamA/TamA family outer membrane protein, partial [Candidatus Krumholzibacterium sp.]|nr:BamA/TamA family outer membrane protein [Candidatus Krumholzibacterium sp.]